MASDEYQALSAQNSGRAKEIARIFIKAAKETHAVVIKAEAKSRKAMEGIASQNKQIMWRTLQDYIREYADFIGQTSVVTGIGLYKVDHAFYDHTTTTDIEGQLQLAIGFVYAKEALTSTVKENYKQCVEKHLKRLGLFSDNELKYMFW